MFKRLGLIFTALALLAGVSVFAPVSAAYAAGNSAAATTATSGQNDVTSLIWQGLWAGSNANFDNIFSPSGSTTSPPSSQNSQNQQSPGTNQPKPAAGNTYAALGDSVAAGVGLPTPVQVPSNEVACGRTAESYPYIVAQSTGLGLVDRACSGATAGDLFTRQNISGPGSLPPQLDAAFAGGTPQLITITAGANDAHWQQFLYTCYYTNCATSAVTLTANAYLAVLQLKLYALFTDIQARSHGAPSTVIYTGYYNPVSSACSAQNSQITAAEVTWLTAEVNALNTTIRHVADRYAFVRFAPINFSGHDICSSQPWIQGLQDEQPFHPTVTGQQVIARSVLGAR